MIGQTIINYNLDGDAYPCITVTLRPLRVTVTLDSDITWMTGTLDSAIIHQQRNGCDGVFNSTVTRCLFQPLEPQGTTLHGECGTILEGMMDNPSYDTYG